MRKIVFLALAALALAGCASKGPAPADTELTLNLLTDEQGRGRFYVDGAVNPFTSYYLRITTQPKYFLTAVIHVPKSVGRVEIEYMLALSEGGEQITEAATKEYLLEYWDTMAGESDTKKKQKDGIERYYIPSNVIEGKKLGRDYAVVFVSKEPFKPTDRVEARILVDGEEKLFELDASAVVKAKKN